MISFIITCIVLLSLSACIGGLPSIVFAILLELKGLGPYVYALTILIASFIELIKFISYMFFSSSVELNPKELFKMIKSLFNKDKNNKKGKNSFINKTKNKSTTVGTIEIIVIVAFTLYAIFVPVHSVLASLIYKNIIVRILSVILIPLIICNIINEVREDFSDFFGAFSLELLIPLFIGFIIAPCIMFTADVWHEDISKSIQSWYTYDDNRFDEARKRDDFKGEYDFLKSSYEKAYNELINTCDINETTCLNDISINITRNTNIKEYGYTVTNSFQYDDETKYLCIADKKTKKYKFYKMTFKDFSFELSCQEEYERLLNEKN